MIVGWPTSQLTWILSTASAMDLRAEYALATTDSEEAWSSVADSENTGRDTRRIGMIAVMPLPIASREPIRLRRGEGLRLRERSLDTCWISD